MSTIPGLLDWFAGGTNRYMTLVHCMNHDMPWIRLTVALDLLIAAGYVVIAFHWWSNERPLKQSPAKQALKTLKAIFVFCGICGYLFIPIKMFWPAWRLYDLFLAALAYYTWRYALNAHNFKVVYNALERSERLSRDLAKSQDEARRKSEFLNAVSHDLKTPLNGLLLQVDLAEMSVQSNDPEMLKEALEHIRSCARTSADLLNTFLELGRLDWSGDALVLDDFDLGQFVGELAERMRARAEGKGLSVSADVPKGLIIRSDRLKLERSLVNLIDNAIKFTHEGGIRVIVEETHGRVAIHVEDTGEGIAAEDQARIFDDFVQVHNRERDSRKGYGLGLAITRRLAECLRADLLLDSQPGRGTRFSLVIPRILAPNLPGSALKRPSPGSTLQPAAARR